MSEKWALLSVFKKEPNEAETFMGITQFARFITQLGWKLIASGGTCTHLRAAGLAVTDVADITGGGEILGHRVVTLSREKSAALLARDTPDDRAELAQLGVPRIDMVVCDTYPLEEAIAEGLPREKIVEMIDIGGPTMLSEAAKGERIVVCDPEDRAWVIEMLGDQHVGAEGIDERAGRFREYLAAKADAFVANYRLASARWRSEGAFDGAIYERVSPLRYGTNKNQAPAVQLRSFGKKPHPLAPSQFDVLFGELGANNLGDLARGVECLTRLEVTLYGHSFPTAPKSYIVVGLKHQQPCCVGVAYSAEVAMQRAILCDPEAIFGGTVVTNFGIDASIARILRRHGLAEGETRTIDVVAAPWYSPEAQQNLPRANRGVKILQNHQLEFIQKDSLDLEPRWLQLSYGEMVREPANPFILSLHHPDMLVFGRRRAESARALLVAYVACAAAKSNTIAIAAEYDDGSIALIGLGAGQVSRLEAAKLAVSRARTYGHADKLVGAVAASDSFFPFTDGVRVLLEAGVNVIFATEGGRWFDSVTNVVTDVGATLYSLPDKEARGFQH